MNIEDIDIEKLRIDLIDYFGSAMISLTTLALMDLSRVEKANDEELIQIALQNGFKLEKYIKKFKKY